MATQLYTRTDAALAPSIAPSFDAGWDETSGTINRRLLWTVQGSDAATGSTSSWTSGNTRINWQYISQKLKAGQTIDGTVTVVIAAQELDASDNAIAMMGVRVFSSDGTTVRATLLPVGAYGTQLELSVNPNTYSRIVADAEPLTSYTTQAGDRIVMEFGFTDNAGTTPQGLFVFATNRASDYSAVDDDTTQRNPLVEFSADLEFLDGSGVTNVAERGPDTLFFGYSATGGSALATDLSGNDTDWTHATSWICRNSWPGGHLSSAWAIEAAVLIDNTDTGYIYSRNYSEDPGNIAISADGSGNLDFVVAGSTVANVALPDASATSQLMFIQWAMEANPLTTGAGDTRRHDVRIYNADAGTWDGTQFTTGTPADVVELQNTVAGAALSDGTSAFSGTLRMVRLSSHHHTPAELERCFLDVSAAPTVVGVTRLGWPTMQHGDAAWGDDGYFAGPPHIWTAKAAHRNDMRLWGPLVNEVYSANANTSDEQWTALELDTGTYRMHLSTLTRRPLPLGCDRVRVRVYVENNAASGSLNLRSYVSDRPGWLVKPGPSPNQHTYEYVAQTGIAFGVAGYYSFDHTIAPRDSDGFLYHFLAINDSAAESSYIVRCVSVEPINYGGPEA